MPPTYEILDDPRSGPQIVYGYTAEDGGQGMHLIPIEALATRMALLNIDDPGQALDIILDEQGLGEHDNPYACVYRAMAEGDPEPTEAFREALGEMPTSARCDGRHEAEFKERLRSDYGAYLSAVRWQFVAESTGPGISEAGGE